MAERKSLREASRATDEAFRKLEAAMGTEMAVRLTPEVNEAKGAVFSEVLDQASFSQLWAYNNAPQDLVLRASAEESGRRDEVVQAALKVYEFMEEKDRIWRERNTPSDGNLVPGPGEVAYEFRRPRESVDPPGMPLVFPEDYQVAATVSGKASEWGDGIDGAIQAAESSGRYEVRGGDVITTSAGEHYRVAGAPDDHARGVTWERMPGRGAGGRTAPNATEAGVAKAVEEDARTWKAIRSQGTGEGRAAGGREGATQETHER